MRHSLQLPLTPRPIAHLHASACRCLRKMQISRKHYEARACAILRSTTAPSAVRARRDPAPPATATVRCDSGYEPNAAFVDTIPHGEILHWRPEKNLDLNRYVQVSRGSDANHTRCEYEQAVDGLGRPGLRQITDCGFILETKLMVVCEERV